MGWEPTKRILCVFFLSAQRIKAAFVLPTSVKGVPGFANFPARVIQDGMEDTGVQMIIKSANGRILYGFVLPRSMAFLRTANWILAEDRLMAMTSIPRKRFFKTSPRDPPISQRPMMATFRKGMGAEVKVRGPRPDKPA